LSSFYPLPPRPPSSTLFPYTTLFRSVKRAGSLDADKVREALLKLDMKTMFGEYKVDQDGFQVAHKMVLFQWHEGKKFTVWPDELAAAKPHFPTPPWNQR